MCTSGDLRTAAALASAGTSRREIARAVDAGELRRVRRGVYAGPGVCASVVAACAHGGVLACVSAARHAGLWVVGRDLEPHVWMGRNGRRYHATRCGCVEHWDAGPTVSALSIPRILAQILHCRGVEDFFVTLESARRKRLIGAEGMAWLRRRVGVAGREALALSRDDADSGLESLFRWRLRHRGLRIRTQLSVYAVGRVDLLIGERLLVETDGIDNHDDATHRHKDLVRDANAAAWGYVTLRFDYALVIHDWDTVEAAVLGAVAAGRHL